MSKEIIIKEIKYDQHEILNHPIPTWHSLYLSAQYLHVGFFLIQLMSFKSIYSSKTRVIWWNWFCNIWLNQTLVIPVKLRWGEKSIFLNNHYTYMVVSLFSLDLAQHTINIYNNSSIAGSERCWRANTSYWKLVCCTSLQPSNGKHEIWDT